MLAEALSQFYRHARCTNYQYSWLGNIPESRFPLLSLYRVGTVVHQYGGYPCTLEVVLPDDKEEKFYAIREHMIGDWEDFEYREEEVEIVPHYASLKKYPHQNRTDWALILPDYRQDLHDEPSDPELSALVEHLEIYNHMVKDLTLEFHTPIYLDRKTHPEIMQGGKERTVHVDMSYLERLGANFDRVELILGAWRVVRSSWDHRMFVKIQQEFLRVAKVLVGAGDGATWVLRDWFSTGITDDITGGWHLEVRRVLKWSSEAEVTYEGLF